MLGEQRKRLRALQKALHGMGSLRVPQEQSATPTAPKASDTAAAATNRDEFAPDAPLDDTELQGVTVCVCVCVCVCVYTWHTAWV